MVKRQAQVLLAQPFPGPLDTSGGTIYIEGTLHWPLAFSGGDADQDIRAALEGWAQVWYLLAPHLQRLDQHHGIGTEKVGQQGAAGNADDKEPPRIRVAFVSSWLCNSAIGRFVGPLLKELGKREEALHVVAVHTPGSGCQDALTRDAIAASVQQFVTLPEGASLADRLRSLALDCLVYVDVGMEVMGFATAMLRIAPVQVVMWGHPTTSGLRDSIDYYVLPDSTLGPNKGAEAFSEQLVRFDGLGTIVEMPDFSKLEEDEATGADELHRWGWHLPPDATVYGCLQVRREGFGAG